MSSYLKGNFPLETLRQPGAVAPDPTGQFERAALRRLAGSIAFVTRKGFMRMGKAECGMRNEEEGFVGNEEDKM